MSGIRGEEERGLHGSRLVLNLCRPDLRGQFFMHFDDLYQGCLMLGEKWFLIRMRTLMYVNIPKNFPGGEIVLKTLPSSFSYTFPPLPIEANFQWWSTAYSTILVMSVMSHLKELNKASLGTNQEALFKWSLTLL